MLYLLYYYPHVALPLLPLLALTRRRIATMLLICVSALNIFLEAQNQPHNLQYSALECLCLFISEVSLPNFCFPLSSLFRILWHPVAATKAQFKRCPIADGLKIPTPEMHDKTLCRRMGKVGPFCRTRPRSTAKLKLSSI